MCDHIWATVTPWEMQPRVCRVLNISLLSASSSSVILTCDRLPPLTAPSGPDVLQIFSANPLLRRFFSGLSLLLRPPSL